MTTHRRIARMLMPLALLSSPHTFAQSAQQPVSASAQTDNTLSPEFKKKAWRALDALDRIDVLASTDSPDNQRTVYLPDAQKAVDDAKYEATTPFDKTVLYALQMAVVEIEFKLSIAVTNPSWKIANDRASQCKTEVRYAITPDALSETGKQDALKGTCNKQTSEWGQGITQ